MSSEPFQTEFFGSNPYAEWYWNSQHIEGSPTPRRHVRLYGDRPYDDFLDEWSAKSFDADPLMRVFAST